jgi:mono/diheme cytochrome c family protein
VKVVSMTAAVAALALLGGCIGQTSEDPPIVPIRNMYNQPRYDDQSKSVFFEDGRTMRPPVAGAVAREMDPELSNHTGRLADDSAWVAEIPADIIEAGGGMKAFAERGQQRFDIYCAPCHGTAADGEGAVAHRISELAKGADPGAAVLLAPTLHTDALRQAPDGQIYATVTNGVRNMPAYRQSIPQNDRWAIVAYVRALQLSQASVRTAMNQESKP